MVKKELILQHTFLKVYWDIKGVAYVILFCINHKVFLIIIVRLLLIGQVIVVNQHLWHTVSTKPKGHDIDIITCQTFMFICWMLNFPYGGICPPPNSHVAHAVLESRGTHNTY